MKMIEDKDFDLQRDLLTLVMHSTVCTFQNRFFSNYKHIRSHPVIYKIKFIQAYKNGATSLQLVYNNVCVAFTYHVKQACRFGSCPGQSTNGNDPCTTLVY